MNIKYIVIVQGEPYSIFSEIIAKFLSKRKIKHKYINQCILGDHRHIVLRKRGV